MTQAKKSRTTFRLECAVSANIRATPDRVWKLLTDAAGHARWNSTVESIDGSIALNERLAIRVPAAPGRTFKPRVSEFVPNQRMVWSDGMAPMFKGVRTFELSPKPDGTTDFSMVEVFTGLMLPMIAGSLPDFAPIFDKYADDLKAAAEAG